MLVTPKAGSVTVVGSVVVGFEQWGTAEPEVVAGDAVDDAAVTAAGVGPEKGEAVAYHFFTLSHHRGIGYAKCQNAPFYLS